MVPFHGATLLVLVCLHTGNTGSKEGGGCGTPLVQGRGSFLVHKNTMTRVLFTRPHSSPLTGQKRYIHVNLAPNKQKANLNTICMWMFMGNSLNVVSLARNTRCKFTGKNVWEFLNVKSTCCRSERNWAIAVRGGSYKSLFLLNSGCFPLENLGNSVLNFGSRKTV